MLKDQLKLKKKKKLINMSSPFQKQFSSKSPLNELKRGEAGFEQDPQEAMFERMSDQMDRQKETDSKPLSKEESKRLHAVSSINYDKVVSSGGVDLGIIKNKNK